jgi:hypothetical protein
MKDINYLYDLLEKSDVSLLGYRFKQERIKDEIISKLPHMVVPEIDSSFSFKSFLRDLKLKSILETSESVKNPEYLVLDLNNIVFENDVLGSRQIQIRNILHKIREDMYSEYSGVYPQTPPYKLLMLTSLYNSSEDTDDFTFLNFSSGREPIQMSDLAIVMGDESMKIIKNRFGNDGDDILISFDKLKDYNYICNYENNN